MKYIRVCASRVTSFDGRLYGLTLLTLVVCIALMCFRRPGSSLFANLAHMYFLQAVVPPEVQQDRIGQARLWLSRLRYEGRPSQAVAELALLEIRQGDLNAARRWITHMQDEPEFRGLPLQDWLLYQARSYEMDAPAIAQTVYTIAAQGLPGWPKPYEFLGHFYFRRHMTDDAAMAFRTAIQLGSDRPAHLHLYAGWALADGGRVEGAIAEYKQALKYETVDEAWANSLEPTRARMQLGNALLRYGDLDGAYAEYQRLLAITAAPPADILQYLYEGLGRLWLLKGRPDLALDMAQKGIRIAPGHRWNYIVLGHAYRELGLCEQARQAYLGALRLSPDLHEAKVALEEIGEDSCR